MTCKHKDIHGCGKAGPCLSPYCDTEARERNISEKLKQQVKLGLYYKEVSDTIMLEAANEIERSNQSEKEGWRYADQLEQERKRLNLRVLQLIDAIEDLMYWDNGAPEFEDARDLIDEIRKENNAQS